MLPSRTPKAGPCRSNPRTNGWPCRAVSSLSCANCFPAAACRSARVAQSGGDAVDGQVDAPPQPVVVAIAVALLAVAPHEFDLQVVQRVEIRKAVLDRTRER